MGTRIILPEDAHKWDGTKTYQSGQLLSAEWASHNRLKIAVVHADELITVFFTRERDLGANVAVAVLHQANEWLLEEATELRKRKRRKTGTDSQTT